jgi:hypothetical protein
MKTIASPAVRAAAFLCAVAITALMVFVHAADTSLLGAHDVVIAGEPVAVASVSVVESSRR